MKRWIHSATEVKTYRNKRNPNKYVEVHEDGYGHRSAKQYMEWEDVGVKNPVGDGNLHRWRKGNMNELLDDYEEIEPSSSSREDGPYADTHLSGCSFDFDLGSAYDARYMDNEICDIFDELGLYCKGTDYRSIAYPGNKLYSQCQVDFEWSGSYDAKAIEDALTTFINDEGGNFFGIDFYSLTD